MDAPAEKKDPPAPRPFDQALRAFLRTSPAPAAALTLVAYAVVPIAGLIAERREAPSVWSWSAWILLAAALVPSAAVFFRRDWAHVPSAWLAWAGLVGVVLRALSTGPITGHIFFAGYSAMLVAFSGAARAPAPSPGTPERRPESLAQWARENVEAIVIAFIMALVIRCFCIEVFKIPSSSMEPTLLGDASHDPRCPHGPYHLERYPGGDRIMVTKFYYAFSHVERFDVLVFKFPLNQPKNFIKRVVGLPGEKLVIHRGNLFVRKPGGQSFGIARRTLRTQDSVWVDLARGRDFFSDPGEFLDHWTPLALPEAPGRAVDRLQDRELFTQEQDGHRSLRFKYKGPFHDGHHQDVGELRIAFDFELTSPQGQVFAEVANEHGRFELVLATDGAGRLRWTRSGDNPEKVTEDIRSVRLEMDRLYRLDLSVFDGIAYARVDGRVVAKISYLEDLEGAKGAARGDVGIQFGSRDATFRARRLAVGRDLYYKGKDGISEDEVVSIKPGHYLMMGDNVDSSHDSRSWKVKGYRLTDGTLVECELQDVGNTKEVKIEDVQRRYGVEHSPDVFIPGDRNGTPWLLYRNDPGGLPAGLPVGIIAEDGELDPLPFHEIHEQFIVGKGLWIWWPPGRWFHLIR